MEEPSPSQTVIHSVDKKIALTLEDQLSKETHAENNEIENKVNDENLKKKNQKKPKKKKYKDLIGSIMSSSISEEEEKRLHQEKLQKSLGGGQFSKLDKI